MSVAQFESRKRDHLKLALKEKNQSFNCSGLESIHLHHDAIPELNFDALSIRARFLDHDLNTPFMITGMTAGHKSAQKLNALLAKSCAARGWVLGVGSQRRDLDFESSPKLDHLNQLKDKFSDLILISNLGASQFVKTPVSKIDKLVETSGASAIAVHFNALQEVLQVEGTPQFQGVLNALRSFKKSSAVKLIVKETGCGFSRNAILKLKGLPLAALDVSGTGGTHWGRIEGDRAQIQGAQVQARAARVFSNWGESTVDSVLNSVSLIPKVPVIASGGVRTGLDAAKLLAIGASTIGFAKPALEAALKGPKALDQWMEQIEFELKVALFCMGVSNLKELKIKRGLWSRLGSSIL